MKERSLFANSAWGVIAQLARGAAGLAFVPVAVGTIGLEGYGLYSIIMLFSLYQGIAAQIDFGYPAFLINHIARVPGSLKDPSIQQRLRVFTIFMLVCNALLFALCLMIPDFLAGLFKADLSRTKVFSESLAIVILANFFTIIFVVASAVWTASHRFAHVKKFETSAYFLFVALAIVLLAVKPDLSSIATAFLVSQAYLGLSIWFATRKHLEVSIRPGIASFSFLKSDWPIWRPFFFSRLNGLAQRQSDITLVSVLLGPQFVAAYDISMKVPSLVRSLMGKVSEILGPFASQRRHAEDLPFIRTLSEKLVAIQVSFGVYLAATMFYFGGDVAAFWLGDNQRNLGHTLFIATLINIAVPPASVLLSILLGQGKRSSQLTWWPTAISIFNIAATIPITSYFGVKGTLALTVLQFAMLSALGISLAKKDFNFSLFPTFISVVKTLGPALFFNFIASTFLKEISVVQFLILQAGIGLTLILFHFSALKEIKRMLRRKASGTLV